ncbi:IS3 family transposase [Corynebacterium diphtheriae]|uniref:IS3 family transposase n=5 Tax=Actinomycetes TaxID=1760 RepID=UPI00217DAF46|nr:IS3 family transposase [Corynebacterium diphtheriae]
MAAQRAQFPIALMARLLEVSRAGFYQWFARRLAASDKQTARVRFDRMVRQLFFDYAQTHGSPRLAAALQRDYGIQVDKKRVAASLKRQGLEAISTRQFRLPHGFGTVAMAHLDHCERVWDRGAIDKVWITDFTYLRSGEGWGYLIAIRDAHSKRVLGYAMGDEQNTDLVTQALAMAMDNRGNARPEAVVLHADRGCQFTSTQLSRFATNIGATLSMGRTGVCWDNAMAESFWASLKIEKFYRRAYATRRQVYSDISAWIEGFYNHKRIHSSIGMQSPIEYELALQQHTAQAA